MKISVFIVCLLFLTASAHAAVNLVINQKAGAVVQQEADRLAGKLASEIATPVNVVILSDGAQIEAWLNRFAAADLALVDGSFSAGRPGQFVVIGTYGSDHVLIGRQGISVELMQKAAKVLGRGEERLVKQTAATPSVPSTFPPRPSESPSVVSPRQTAAAAAEPKASPPPVSLPQPAAAVMAPPLDLSKSIEEDRYFVGYAYRERLNRDPDAEHLEFWTSQLQNGAVSKQQLLEKGCDLEGKSCRSR